MKINEKVKQMLNYIGSIGAGFMCIAYIVMVFVLIKGFAVKDLRSTIIFAVVNGIVGLIVANMLKYQGISFARAIPENAELERLYYSTRTSDKELHDLNYFWRTSIVKDIIFKGVSIIASTTGIMYLVITGSNDWNMLLLSLVNLIMFICFGILALNKAYDYYNNTYVAYMKEKIEEAKEASSKKIAQVAHKE